VILLRAQGRTVGLLEITGELGGSSEKQRIDILVETMCFIHFCETDKQLE